MGLPWPRADGKIQRDTSAQGVVIPATRELGGHGFAIVEEPQFFLIPRRRVKVQFRGERVTKAPDARRLLDGDRQAAFAGRFVGKRWAYCCPEKKHGEQQPSRGRLGAFGVWHVWSP